MSCSEIITLLTLMQLTIDPPVWLLGNLICEKSIGMIAGPRGCGKSFLVLLIAYAIVARKLLQPWGEGSGGAVLYVDAEMRLFTIQERLRLIHAKNSNPESIDDFGDRFRIISRDLSPSSIGAIDTVEGQNQIESLIATDTKFVVLDNYSALSSGGSESSSAWATAKTWLIQLRQRGISVLIVHHAGKNGQQRGSSAHEDILDYSILLSPLPGNAELGDTRFAIEHTKLREFVPELRQKFVCSFWTEDGSVLRHEITPMEAETSELTQAILQLDSEGLSQSKIADKIGKHKSTISRTLKKARQHAQKDDGSKAS